MLCSEAWPELRSCLGNKSKRADKDNPFTTQDNKMGNDSKNSETFADYLAEQDKTEDGKVEQDAPLESVTLEEQVIEALKHIYDPEIPINIYDLGLIYGVDVDSEGGANIRMTLTTPGCPVAQTFPGTVESMVKRVPGVTEATVELVWDPPWTQELLSEAARVQLGLI